MKKCNFCGTENEDIAVFCDECGKSFFKKKCDKCGAENRMSAKFCNQCGSSFNDDAKSESNKADVARAKHIPIINEPIEEPNIIYYEATQKIELLFINVFTLSHKFANGKGEVKLIDATPKNMGKCIRQQRSSNFNGYSKLRKKNREVCI